MLNILKRKLLLLFVFIVELGSLFCVASMADASWPPGGVLLSDAPRTRYSPRCGPDGLGGAFVTWVDFRTVVDYDVYLQHVTLDGALAPNWSSGGFAVCTAKNDQYPDTPVPDGLGGCYVTWVDYRANEDLYCQRVTSDGHLAPGWPVDGLKVAVSEALNRPAVVQDGTGGVFIAFGSRRGGAYRVYVQRIAGEGQIASGWPEQWKSIGNLPGAQYDIDAISDGAGGLYVTWAELRDDPLKVDLFALRLTSSGDPAPGWPANGIPICLALGEQSRPRLVSDGSGGAFIVWQDFRSAPPNAGMNEILYADIYAQHLLPNATVDAVWPANGLPVSTGANTQWRPEVCSDGVGGVFAGWIDYRSGQSDIYAQHLRANGAIVEGWVDQGSPAGDLPGPDDYMPPPVADGMGGVFLVWQHNGVQRNVLTQHFNSAGQIATGWQPGGSLLVTTSGEQLEPWITGDPFNGAIAAWNDSRRGPNFHDVYAIRFGGDGPTAVSVSLVNAAGVPGIARMAWQVAGAVEFTLERRSGALFVSVAKGSPDGNGRLNFEDHVPEPGSWTYRLSFVDEGVQRFTPEVTVDVPSARVLSLAGFQPNPASGPDLAVAFSLAREAPGTLTLHDIAGREIARESLGGLAPGRHTLKFGTRSHVPAGVYWVRLIHDNRVLTARGVVVR